PAQPAGAAQTAHRREHIRDARLRPCPRGQCTRSRAHGDRALRGSSRLRLARTLRRYPRRHRRTHRLARDAARPDRFHRAAQLRAVDDGRRRGRLISMHYDPRSEPHGLAFDPFKALVAPRPIGWIGTIGPDGVPNLAPYSFFNAVSDKPPFVLFSSVGRKDSQANIEASGEFTCSFANWDLREQMN